MRITGFEPGDATHYRVGWDGAMIRQYGKVSMGDAFAFGIGDDSLVMRVFPEGFVSFGYFAEKMAMGRLKADSVAMWVAFRVFAYLRNDPPPTPELYGTEHIGYHVWKENWRAQLVEGLELHWGTEA